MTFFNLVPNRAKTKNKSKTSSQSPSSNRRNKQLSEEHAEIKRSSSSESTDVESSEETWVDAKLIKAKERRDEVTKSREDAVNLKLNIALARAEQNLRDKKIKVQKRLNRVDAVKERRMFIEEKRCTSIESRLQNAMKRANQVKKSRQIQARRDERMERVKSRRTLNEYEKRSALLSDLDKRLDRATKNLKLRLYDRQSKARGEVQQAKLKAKKVKAVKIIQRVVRQKFGFCHQADDEANISQNDAARRLQSWKKWRIQVIARTLQKSESASNSSIDALNLILSTMGYGQESIKTTSFQKKSSALGNPLLLDAGRQVLKCLCPILGEGTICERTFLSAFLVASHPDEVLGRQYISDKCSSHLFKASQKLIRILQETISMQAVKVTHIDPKCEKIEEIISNLVSYSALFDLWKSKDLQELVDGMMQSAEQSWIIFITSKEAIKLTQETSSNSALYQFQLRYESSFKGAGTHIKRIRASFNKLLGSKEGLKLMKEARQAALRKIEEDNLIDAVRSEANLLINPEPEPSEGKVSEGIVDTSMDEEAAPEDFTSDAEMVHRILLSDQDEDILLRNDTSVDTLQDVSAFMKQWHEKKVVKSVETNHDIRSIEGVIAQTMQIAVFNKIEEDLTSNDMNGIKHLVLNLFEQMKKLIPNRSDLHSHFTEDDVDFCRGPIDVLQLLIRAADALVQSLESQHRSHSTQQWKQSAMTLMKDVGSLPYDFKTIESFVVSSTAFLIKKAELCHLDIISYQMMRASPIIRMNGREYELRNFQKVYGGFDSMSSMKQLNATWLWMQKCIKEDTTLANLTSVIKKDGYIDELLFSNDRFVMPEVLALDSAVIMAIRSFAKTAVVSSALFLHAANISGIGSTHLSCESLSSAANYFRTKIISSVLHGSSDDKTKDELIDATCSFAKAISGNESTDNVLGMDKIRSLTNCVVAVMDGNDAVLKLLDSRMKKFFQYICTIQTKKQVPDSMRSGTSTQTNAKETNSNAKRFLFTRQAIREANKFGFTLVSSEIAEKAYDAQKIICHCIDVYKENVFEPMFSEIKLES